MRTKVLMLLALLASSCGGSGCAGTAARENVMVPALRVAWPQIRDNIDRDPAPDAAVVRARADMNIALDGGEVLAIGAVNWPVLRLSATRGIAEMVRAGEISVGVSGPLLERLEQFEKSLSLLRGA